MAGTAKKVVGYVGLERLSPPRLNPLSQFSELDSVRPMQLQDIQNAPVKLPEPPVSPLLKRLAVELEKVACGNRAPIKLLLCLTPERSEIAELVEEEEVPCVFVHGVDQSPLGVLRKTVTFRSIADTAGPKEVLPRQRQLREHGLGPKVINVAGFVAVAKHAWLALAGHPTQSANHRSKPSSPSRGPEHLRCC